MSTTKTVKDPVYIPGQNFKLDNLAKSKLVENPNKLYVNAFPITFNKDISVYEYPFTIVPETNDDFLISKIFAQLSFKIKEIYGYFYQSGKKLYSLKEVLEPKEFSVEIAKDTKINYTLQVDNKSEFTTIKKGQNDNFSQIHQKMIFLIIREILTTNPTVKIDKDNFYIKEKQNEKDYPYKIKGKGQTYAIYDGYKLSLKQTENGLCLSRNKK